MTSGIVDSPALVLHNVSVCADPAGLPLLPVDRIVLARSLRASSGKLLQDNSPCRLDVVLRFPMISHYFHFMEFTVLLFALKNELFPYGRMSNVYIGLLTTQPYMFNIFEILFPGAELVAVLGDEPHICPEYVLYLDYQDTRSSINKFIDTMLPWVIKWASSMRSQMFTAMGLQPRSAPSGVRRLSCMYARRKPPRTFSPEIERWLLEELSFMDINVAEFFDSSWPQQIIAVSQCDVLIGIHGNALTSALWLPPHGVVIEFFPEETHHYDIQIFCEAMRTRYIGLAGETVFSNHSRFGPAYGHGDAINKPVTDIHRGGLLFALEHLRLLEGATY